MSRRRWEPRSARSCGCAGTCRGNAKPCSTKRAGAMATSSDTAGVTPDSATLPDGLVILHVEDDPNDLFFVQHAFNKVTPTATLHDVRDGELATRYLSGQPPYEDRGRHPTPDLVLMDLKLPKRNGHEVLEWIRSQPGMRTMPVVILSSSTERSDIERAYRLGANAYVAKQGDL